MRPLINLKDIDDFQENSHESFGAIYANIRQKIGAEKLGYNITIISQMILLTIIIVNFPQRHPCSYTNRTCHIYRRKKF